MPRSIFSAGGGDERLRPFSRGTIELASRRDARAPRPTLPSDSLHDSVPSSGSFRSFFLGGFECSTHRIRSGRRLDVVAGSRHDRWVREDYERLRSERILAAREGLRWHLIEKRPGHLDFSTALPFVRAAREIGIQLVWDLCHYGWPDDLDVWTPEFVERFANLADGFARLLAVETDAPPFIAPVNEISFFSWASGQVGWFYPYARRRGGELKAQLVRAAIAATRAVRAVDRNTRIVHTDPLINVVASPRKPQDERQAEGYRQAQYDAVEMVLGRQRPELGGREEYVDLVGLNYYFDNQWYFGSGWKIARGHKRYRPLHDMLRETHERLRRPLFIAETGIENKARPEWLRWVCEQVRTALDRGVPVEGICLYPILNHPGWVDNRHCHNGLWDYADRSGVRPIYLPLAEELRAQQALFAERENGVEAAG
jgi:hypothetical protein